MAKYFFDCHEFNGYTGCCCLKGGECNKVCDDWISEEQYLESIAETDIKISLSKLREILVAHTDRLGAVRSSVDLLIKTIKQDLAKEK